MRSPFVKIVACQIAGAAIVLALLASSCVSISGNEVQAAEALVVTPYDDDCIYETGQKVGWKVEASENGSPLTYRLRKNNFATLKEGELDVSDGEDEIDIIIEEPAMVFLEIKEANEKKPLDIAGAAVAPIQLRPSVPAPEDFDAFWKTKISELQAVPANPVLKQGESGNSNVEYGLITMDHVNGGHIHGQYAKPKKLGKKPALIIFQWASPPYPLQREWIMGHAAQGWLTVNIMPHDVLPTEPQEYYDALPDEIKKYESIGNNDRDKSHFLRMYLAAYRAVDYLANHPEWDGKTLVCMGTSMGGQQSLAAAGLHPKVTHIIANVPAGCDTNGPLHGRQASYPNFPVSDPQVAKTALYFDVVNLAPHIRATTLIGMGFVDEVSAPAGIWTAFNLIPGPKEIVPLTDMPHNHQATPEQLAPYEREAKRWLGTLVQGKPVGIRRFDENSQLVHQQLLEKAKQGGIDVYFLGDSITRRWGTSDKAYAPLSENWKKNFFGWNAGNFGWGGDTTQNILWRLENGELDGVNPKAIVLLAGTNNVGGPTQDEAKVDEVVSSIEAILDVCQQKAPKAKIILTAIFPRNDNRDAISTINRINAKLEKLADGDKIRFLNVNDKLADPDGNLFEGMAHDGLHLNVEGYQVWADGLKPILQEILGPPAKTDHAPPPTGDPSAR
jgi:cephalosporin-C deacetylase